MKSFVLGMTIAVLIVVTVFAIVETYRVASHAIELARLGVWQPISLALCMIAGIAWAARKLWTAAVEE